jgi:murein hydrolase activator
MNRNEILFVFICFLLFTLASGSVLAQTSEERGKLEAEKKENLRKIEEAQKILNETASARKTSLGQLNAINQQIKARESLIEAINAEIALLDNQIGEITNIMEALEADLLSLKEEYAAMLYAASKAGKSQDRLTFIFSAKTFNQLVMRIKYMEQYAEARQKQVAQIERVRETLAAQRSSIDTKRSERKQLLEQQVDANQALLALKKEQNSAIQNLAKREKELQKELVERKEAVQRLDNLIASLIEKEIRESSKGKSSNTIALNSEEAKELSTLFEKTKSNLAWPVTSGFISRKFGRNPHPVMKYVMEENNGVDIQTSKDAKVQAVFDGVVKTVAVVPGMNKVVITQHGDYFTLYARLKDVYVQKGQNIKADESIGTVYTDPDQVSTLHFEIWRNNQKLNPQEWLTKK